LEPRPKVIILNGAGSVGKSSTARALQEISATPFLHIAMDSFLDMLPKKIFGQPKGLIFDTVQDQGKPCIVIRTGRAVEQAIRGMRYAVAAMAAQGNNLIVDEVMIEGTKDREYCALLSPFDVRFVGLSAPLDVLEARERDRGDREIGLARWQYNRVHHGITYNLEIDTTGATPSETARMIREPWTLIPRLPDQNPFAQLRSPMDMIRQGWSRADSLHSGSYPAAVK
jgi:chloramphenicol 3-O phosphotransferase